MTFELRLFVVADDPLARSGLAALVEAADGLKVVGQGASGDDLVAACATYRPDVLLWDLGWESENAADLLSDGADELPPIVALAQEEANVHILSAGGISGLLLRDASGPRLAAALSAVAAGLVVADPVFRPIFGARSVSGSMTGFDESMPLVEELTKREREVLQLVAEGLANKGIAHRLEISEHTVKFHLNSIMGKLGAQSRTDAVVRATRSGLLLL